MITVPAGIRVLVATRPVDFRKGGDGLAVLVREVLGEHLFSGMTSFSGPSERRVKIWRGLGPAWRCSGNGWSTGHSAGRRSVMASCDRLRAARGAVDGMDWSRLDARDVARRLQRCEHCDFLNHLRTMLIRGKRIRLSVACERYRTSASYRHRSAAGLVAAVCAERYVAIAERDEALSQIDLTLSPAQCSARIRRRSEKLDPENCFWRLRTSSKPCRQRGRRRQEGRSGRRARAEKRRANRGALPPICRAWM